METGGSPATFNPLAAKPGGGKRARLRILPGAEVLCAIRGLSATVSVAVRHRNPRSAHEVEFDEQPAGGVRLRDSRQVRRVLCGEQAAGERTHAGLA